LFYKKITYRLVFFVMGLMALTAIQLSCQEALTPEEELPVISVEVITFDSEFLELIKLTTLKDGRVDDLIDDFSCGSLVYPLTLTVNDQSISLQDEGDIQLVRDLFDANSDDYDYVRFNYPLSMVDEQYIVFEVADEASLDALIEDCEANFQLNAVSCVDFQYIVYLISYDQEKEVSNNFRIETDAALYEFMIKLNAQELVSILFPIIISNPDGSTTELRNGTELQSLLAQLENTDCFTPEVVATDDTAFRNLLFADDFIIKEYIENSSNRTAEFNGYNLTYNSVGTSQATTTATTIDGAWSIDRDYSNLELDIDFPQTDLIGDLDLDWDIMSYNDLEFNLRFRDKYLTQRRLAAITPNELETLFITELWEVSLYFTDSDETSLFANRIFTFNNIGEVRASINNAGVEGVWSVKPLAPFDLSLNMTFEDVPPFTRISTDWFVQNYNANEIVLVQLDAAGIVVETLVFTRL
jgi:hypothetical protein